MARELTLSDNEELPGFLWFSPEFLMCNSPLARVLRWFRRVYLVRFRRDYVERAIAKRQGDCNRCGACCELILRCPFLGHDAQNLPYCRVYGTLQPEHCRTYPFDRVDSGVEICSFSFK